MRGLGTIRIHRHILIHLDIARETDLSHQQGSLTKHNDTHRKAEEEEREDKGEGE